MLSDTTILVALGGNALAPSATLSTITEQFAQTRAAMDLIMPFIRQGYRLAITHGNGPQVGDELLRVELGPLTGFRPCPWGCAWLLPRGPWAT